MMTDSRKILPGKDYLRTARDLITQCKIQDNYVLYISGKLERYTLYGFNKKTDKIFPLRYGETIDELVPLFHYYSMFLTLEADS